MKAWLYPVPDPSDCSRCGRDSCEGACSTFTEEDAAEDVREIFGNWTETAR